MVDAVKCCRQIQKCQHRKVAGIQCRQYIRQNPQNCRLRRVVRSVRRLKIIVLEISEKLLTDQSLQQLRDDKTSWRSDDTIWHRPDLDLLSSITA